MALIKKNLGFIIFILITAGKVFTSPLPTLYDDSQFRLLLEKHDLLQATKWQFYFEVTEQSVPQNEAQFYIFLGQARKAYQAIEKIEDQTKKKLFKAVLFSLVSTPRESDWPNEPNEPVELPKTTIAEWRFPIDSGEIWPDEWQDIEFLGDQKREMPIVQDEVARLEFKSEAKALFETLTYNEFLTDFNIVALALDVEAKIPEVEKILSHFSVESESPYYKRLEKLLSPAALVRLSQKTIKQDSLEVHLTDFNLNWNEAKSHEVTPPFLLTKWVSP